MSTTNLTDKCFNRASLFYPLPGVRGLPYKFFAKTFLSSKCLRQFISGHLSSAPKGAMVKKREYNTTITKKPL